MRAERTLARIEFHVKPLAPTLAERSDAAIKSLPWRVERQSEIEAEVVHAGSIGRQIGRAHV